MATDPQGNIYVAGLTSSPDFPVTPEVVPARYAAPVRSTATAMPSALGPVSVVVTVHGAASAPATAQLQAVAPAFFQYPGTNYVSASRLPDWAAVADPTAVPRTVAARPGDFVVLKGTEPPI